MNDLDVLATTHLDRLDLPKGAGAEAVMGRGRRHRNQRHAVVASTTAVGVAVVLIGFALAFQVGGGNGQLVITDSAATNTSSAPTNTSSDDVATSDAFMDAAELLPDRDASLVPNVATPTLKGWSIEVTRVDLFDRFTGSGETVRYRLSAAGSELSMTVMTGQVALVGESVTVERPTGAIDASIEPTSDGLRRLSWNETPGVNTGTAVTLLGPADDQLLGIAAAVNFVDRPLSGASDPTLVDLNPDRSTLFAGTVDGLDWTINLHPDGDTSIEMDGQSPAIGGALARTTPTGAAIDTTTVSRDGHQITVIVAPADTATIAFGLTDGTRIPLPLHAHEETGRRIAAAVVPADRDAPVIVVIQDDGTETSFGLPVAPPNGWTTSKQTLRPN